MDENILTLKQSLEEKRQLYCWGRVFLMGELMLMEKNYLWEISW